MPNVTTFADTDGTRLAYKIGRDLPEGLSAYSRDDDYVQVLTWNYPRGKHLQDHAHLVAAREAQLTQEAVVVVRGCLRVRLYDDERKPMGHTEVGAGECMVFLAGGHGYEVMEDDTHVFEIKNGPFLGVERDKVKF